MIRAIIGTVAVLAGFAVLENASDASTGLAGSCKATQAYALLRPGEQLPVRARPTPEAPVLGALSTLEVKADLAASVVTMTGSQSGWARIALNSTDYTAISGVHQQQYGWIPADLLTVDSRIDGAITVYSRTDALGHQIGRIEHDDQKFRVLSCHGDMLQVINARIGQGWIDRWCGRGEYCRS